MSQHKEPSCLLVFLGTIGGSIAGFVLVIMMMMSASRSGTPVGFEGIFYLLVAPIAGGVMGAKACTTPSKKN